MAANEISERLRAAAWVQCGAAPGGEGVDQFSPAQLRFRSYVGFKNRIITTVDGLTVPLILLELDEPCARSECAIYAFRHATVGANDVSRLSYPFLPIPAASYASVWAQPFQMAWLGPNLEAPTWYPMGLAPGPNAVPDGFNLDLFDAIAVLLPTVDGEASSGDFSVLVMNHPPLEGSTLVLQVLPAA